MMNSEQLESFRNGWRKFDTRTPCAFHCSQSVFLEILLCAVLNDAQTAPNFYCALQLILTVRFRYTMRNHLSKSFRNATATSIISIFSFGFRRFSFSSILYFSNISFVIPLRSLISNPSSRQ